jgi:hypothetical protein
MEDRGRLFTNYIPRTSFNDNLKKIYKINNEIDYKTYLQSNGTVITKKTNDMLYDSMCVKEKDNSFYVDGTVYDRNYKFTNVYNGPSDILFDGTSKSQPSNV